MAGIMILVVLAFGIFCILVHVNKTTTPRSLICVIHGSSNSTNLSFIPPKMVWLIKLPFDQTFNND
jgi:hypothetical protein